MNETSSESGPAMNRPSASIPPYDDLHIYYLNGRVAGDPLAGDENYIGNWEEGEDSFLFFKRAADDVVARLVERQSGLVLQDRFQMTYEEWQGHAVRPFQSGRLRFVPPWCDDDVAGTDQAIVLDPGVVFGTGRHPTTSDCLTAMQIAFDTHSIATVIDIGTGTGLLALAGARLGAKAVVAVDLNRLAVETARRNVMANRMEEAVVVAQGNAMSFIDISSDLVVSNIHYAVMRELVAAEGFGRHRQFILSGLLRSQAREIEYQLKRRSAEILRKWERDGTWFTYYGRNAA